MDRAQGREERRRGGGRDLGHLAGRAAEGQLGEGREPAVLVGAQADGEDPAGAVGGRLDVGPVRGEPRQEGRVVRTGLAQEGPQRRVCLRARGGREDPRPGVGGPARVGRVDDRDARAEARQLVGERQAHQAGADDGHVAALRVHGHRVHQSPARRASAAALWAPCTSCGRPTSGSPTCRGSPSSPRYATLPDGVRMHFVDEGPAGAETVLLLHGQPTWSYLYRTVVARLVEHGLRAVAPDLVGFGRSDKPLARTAHTVQAHADWVAQFTDAVEPRRPDARGPGLGRPLRAVPPGGAARPRPPGGRRQHGAAHRGRRPGGAAGLAVSRGRGRHRHRGADPARLPAPHPGADAVPAQPLRAGGHRVGGAGPRPGGLRRAVPRRGLLRGAAPAAAADGAHARERLRTPEPAHAGRAGRLRRPVPHGVLRRRPGHRRLGRGAAGARARRRRPRPRHGAGRGALPPGGPGCRAGRRSGGAGGGARLPAD